MSKTIRAATTTLDDKQASASSTDDIDVNEEETPVEDTSPPPDDKEKSIADAVRETVAAHKESESSTDEGQEAVEEVEAEKEVTATEPATEEEEVEKTETKPEEKPVDDKQLPFSKHPRWKEVLKERDTAREEAEKLKPLAKSAEVISTYCQTNNLTEDDFREALDMPRLPRNDPKAFRERLQLYVDNIDITSGTRLPSDLQQKVDDGIIDEETAKELATARMQVTSAKQHGQTTQQAFEQQRKQSIINSLNAWEESKRKTDPDYVKQFDMINDRYMALQSLNPPQTYNEAVLLAERAYNDVKQRLSSYLPKPVIRKVLTTKATSTNNGETLKLDSMEDVGKIVRYAASKHR